MQYHLGVDFVSGGTLCLCEGVWVTFIGRSHSASVWQKQSQGHSHTQICWVIPICLKCLEKRFRIMGFEEGLRWQWLKCIGGVWSRREGMRKEEEHFSKCRPGWWKPADLGFTWEWEWGKLCPGRAGRSRLCKPKPKKKNKKQQTNKQQTTHTENNNNPPKTKTKKQNQHWKETLF